MINVSLAFIFAVYYGTSVCREASRLRDTAFVARLQPDKKWTLFQAPGVVTDLDPDSGCSSQGVHLITPPASHGERKVYMAEVRTLMSKVFWKRP